MLKKIFTCLLYVSVSAFGFKLEAGLEKHFKKIEGEKSCQSIKNIDFIYLINLDHRKEKLQLCLEQLTYYGIVPYRFSAVNGWQLSLDQINDIGVKLSSDMDKGFWGTCYLKENKGKEHHELIEKMGRVYFCHCMSRGAMGIILSHLSVLQDALDAGYETIWVMEDDIEVFKDPRVLSDLVEKLDKATDKQWDVLFTDQDTRDKTGKHVKATQTAIRPNFIPRHKGIFKLRKNINLYFCKIGARYGAYSMIVRRSGMKKILDFLKKYKIFLPYDMEFYLAPGIRMYSVTKDIVSTLIKAPSDNGGPNYKYTMIKKIK